MRVKWRQMTGSLIPPLLVLSPKSGSDKLLTVEPSVGFWKLGIQMVRSLEAEQLVSLRDTAIAPRRHCPKLDQSTIIDGDTPLLMATAPCPDSRCGISFMCI